MEKLNILSLFFTLFFVVDPLGLIPFFLTLLSHYDRSQQRRIILKSHFIAALISLFFIAVGDYILSYLSISSSAFVIAGGVLLFLIAIDMIYARPARTKTGTPQEQEYEGDISVFPLAIPMLSGPGNIAALILFTAQVHGALEGKLLIASLSLTVFAISTLILLLSLSMIRLLGETGLTVVHRLMGLILSALAVQFILNGLKQVGVI